MKTPEDSELQKSKYSNVTIMKTWQQKEQKWRVMEEIRIKYKYANFHSFL